MDLSVYHMINWFFMYSFMGYLLECVVLSLEHKKPVFNRGFGHGPFCIIYGFGAVGAYVLLQPVSGRPVELYFASMAMATCMELVTAYLMIRLFGAFWWDYSHKRFNYKGIICLESSVGWGFLGVFFFYFLDTRVHAAVSFIPGAASGFVAGGLILFYLADFIYCFRSRIKGSGDDDDTPVIGRLKVY